MNIMVATGFNSFYGGSMNHTEVIDVDTMSSCTNLPAIFPIRLDDAVAVTHNSKMVVCGGCCANTGDCYSYSNNAWTLEAFKTDRYGAMSVEIRPGEWLVMGGHDMYHYLDTSRILKDGIFTQGPDLPEPIFQGSTVMLNIQLMSLWPAVNT